MTVSWCILVRAIRARNTKTSVLFAGGTCDWRSLDRSCSNSTEPFPFKTSPSFPGLLYKPPFTMLTSNTCLSRSSQSSALITYDLNSPASKVADCKMKAIRMTSSSHWLPFVLSIPLAKSTTNPGGGLVHFRLCPFSLSKHPTLSI